MKGLKETGNLTIWAEFFDGFKLHLRYLTRAQIRQIHRRSLRREWDSRTHLMREEPDNRLFCELLAREAIIDWSGLTPEVLKKMVLMDPYPADTVSYTPEDAADLLVHSYGFDHWLVSVIEDHQAFLEIREIEAKKNSSPSPGDM